MRGSQALMNIFYKSDINEAVDQGAKCTSKDVRDKAIACRFYYHAGIEGRRYDVCIRLLSKEFYISELVVAQRLMAQQEFIKKLKINSIASKDLEIIYPFFIWK